MDPIAARDDLHRAARPVGQLVQSLAHSFQQVDGNPSDEAWGLCDSGASRRPRCSWPPHPVRCSRSRRVPGESLDSPENLPKEAPRQVALGQLEHEVPGMADQPPAGLEEPLLETRQGPALDGDGQDEPTQQIAEVVTAPRRRSPWRSGIRREVEG
jgi:hypothetical protein